MKDSVVQSQTRLSLSCKPVKAAPFGPLPLSFQANSCFTPGNALVLHVAKLTQPCFLFLYLPSVGDIITIWDSGGLAPAPHPAGYSEVRWYNMGSSTGDRFTELLVNLHCNDCKQLCSVWQDRSLLYSSTKEHLSKFKYSHFKSNKVSQVTIGSSDRWLRWYKRSNLRYRILSLQQSAATYRTLRTVLGTGNHSHNITFIVLKREKKKRKIRLNRIVCTSQNRSKDQHWAPVSLGSEEPFIKHLIAKIFIAIHLTY